MELRNDLVPESVRRRLERTQADPRPVVAMTCGIAGAGKSTIAKAIVRSYPSFTRLSIDAIIHARHGLWGTDYDPSQYTDFQTEAAEIYLAQFGELLRDGRDVVLDRSFYARADRDKFRAMSEAAGARCVLVYLRAGREVLWRRICERRAAGVDADSALEISEGLLEKYVDGFEEPVGEGEIVFQVM